MPRFKITLEYDGTDLCGWQKQDTSPSVYQYLEEAIFKLSGERPQIFVAGRTDAGVHALGQVAHFDLERELGTENVRRGINSLIETGQIAVINAEIVDQEFHARFSAKKRHYLYRILNRPSPSPLDRNRIWHLSDKLDHHSMNEASKVLIGTHDFTSFRTVECQAESPVKTLSTLSVERLDDEIHIKASAQSFLHHMVRNIVGSLKLVGIGKWRAQDLKNALEARDRGHAGPTAPAQGLYLTKVDYS